MAQESWLSIHGRKKPDCYLLPYTKINSKWIPDLNVRPKTMTPLEENKGNAQIQDIGMGRDSSGCDLQSIDNKSKKYKLDHIKLKIFHAAKEIINRFKRQPTEYICKVHT